MLLNQFCKKYKKLFFSLGKLRLNVRSGGDPTKLFFFANEEFFRFSLVSLHFYYIQKKIIDWKMTLLNAEEKKTEKKKFGRIDSSGVHDLMTA